MFGYQNPPDLLSLHAALGDIVIQGGDQGRQLCLSKGSSRDRDRAQLYNPG